MLGVQDNTEFHIVMSHPGKIGPLSHDTVRILHQAISINGELYVILG